MFFNFDDMINGINKNRYIIYSQWFRNLIKACTTPLKVELNAKNISC